MAGIDGFLEELSSAAPVPGGGSVAALQVAMAASLVAMVGNLTIGKKRFVEVEARVRALRDSALEIRDRAVDLENEDVRAYAAVAEVMALPRDSEEAKTRRAGQLQTALKAAAIPPLDTMRLASAVLYLAADMLEVGNPNAVSDVGTAAAVARAGFEGARLNVEINLASIRDDEWALSMRRAMGEIPSPDLVVQSVMQTVTTIIQGAIA